MWPLKLTMRRSLVVGNGGSEWECGGGAAVVCGGSMVVVKEIVAVDRHTTASSFTSFTTHLSKTLYNNKPFVLKYQLPNEDLDSLITISSDEDLVNMLEEHDRIGFGGGVTYSTSSRIRLFMFPVFKECVVGSLLRDPKSESLWFSDALKSSMRGGGGFSEDGESGDSGKGMGGQESIVLETCSSFGSINSSVSGLGGNVAPAPGLVESDNTARIYQDQMISDSESIIYNPSSAVHLQRNPQLSGYQIQHISDQRQQPVQYIQTGSPHYIQYPTGPSPISSYNSYYPMYVPYQQPPNQPYPIYVMPVGPTDQSYTMPAAPTHVANSNVAYKEVQPTPERVAVAPQPIPSVHPVGPTATATPTPTYENEYDNDLAYAQIYKSQPSAPVFPTPKFETMKKAESDLLSDSAQ
nr:hypothetical protein [Tanacetum cinerariifolium]